MTVVEALRRAKALIEDPKHWTQEVYARDANGESVYDSFAAVCWCARGALMYVTGAYKDTNNVYRGADAILREAARPRGVIDINDFGTHADVMKMYDEAITLAEGEHQS